jgi:heme/copper-type cytochrome/quinol oxidase subunit 2
MTAAKKLSILSLSEHRIDLVKTSILAGGIAAIVVIVVAALLLSGGLSGTPSSTGGVKSITLKLAETTNEAKEWVPSEIRLKKGDVVELTVINGDDDDEHRLAIPDLGVETKDIPPANGRTTVKFTADKAGTFKFIDPEVPDWDSLDCKADREKQRDEPLCVPPGKIVVEP